MLQIFKLNSVLFSLLVFTDLLSANEVVKLAVPDFSYDKILNQKIGMKAQHKTSLQLRPVIHYYQEKPIILVHNYGHGEVGWSYAPGSMEIAYENMQKAYCAIGKTSSPSSEHVAVLGAGVNGLMIANKLAENGYPVTIYAEHFSPNTFSDIYNGVFIPVMNPKKAGDELIERLEMLSYKSYQNWSVQKKHSDYWEVSPIDLYIVNDVSSFNFLIAKGLISKPEVVDIDFGTDNNILAMKYQSFVFDTQLIMKEMMKKAKNLGVRFISRRINEVSDCASLGANVVFNCIGLDANKVFLNTNDIPFVGHMVNMSDTLGLDYVMYVNNPDGTYTYWLSKNKKTTIAGTFLGFNQEGISDEIHSRSLLERAKTFVLNQDDGF